MRDIPPSGIGDEGVITEVGEPVAIGVSVSLGDDVGLDLSRAETSDSTEFHMENWWNSEGLPVVRLTLTKSQATKLEAAKHPTKAAFIMGYAQRHPWPANEHWSLVVTLTDYPKATKGAQAVGLLDRKLRKKRTNLMKPCRVAEELACYCSRS